MPEAVLERWESAISLMVVKKLPFLNSLLRALVRVVVDEEIGIQDTLAEAVVRYTSRAHVPCFELV